MQRFEKNNTGHHLSPDGKTFVGVDAGGRDDNQDAAFCSDELPGNSRLLVLADGMGGHAEGEVASAVVIDAAQAECEAPKLDDDGSGSIAFMTRIIDRARTALTKSVESDSDANSTLVMALTYPDRVLTCQFGDSRIRIFEGPEGNRELVYASVDQTNSGINTMPGWIRDIKDQKATIESFYAYIQELVPVPQFVKMCMHSPHGAALLTEASSLLGEQSWNTLPAGPSGSLYPHKTSPSPQPIFNVQHFEGPWSITLASDGVNLPAYEIGQISDPLEAWRVALSGTSEARRAHFHGAEAAEVRPTKDNAALIWHARE